MTTSATTLRRRTGAASGLADPDTYRRSLHLLADLPIGLVTCSAAVGLLALSAGLAVTLVGLPLLVLTLAAAAAWPRSGGPAPAPCSAWTSPRPARRPGWRARLTDAAPGGRSATRCCSGRSGLVAGLLVLLG